MQIQERILKFVTWTNWIILFIASVAGIIMLPPAVAKGIIFGGLIVTVNFHLLYRTLKNALTPPYISSHHTVIAKYYLRFVVSGFIIFVLIAKHIVNPLGLFIGLSVVVVSIMLATVLEFKNLLFKEAV
ncbi:MAG: ATP synthase subunit I [Desulfobacteraceae bacterium]|nr:ATP synthase subunit I [Desulfobacteraceae bacterium]